MVRVTCIKCNREGSLTKKQTKSKGITYEYWYIEHHIGKKIKWCYLGKYEKLSDEYKKQVKNDTQTDTQRIHKLENQDSGLFLDSVAGGVGFEPTTTSLGGLRPILTRLPALRYD